MVDAWSVLLYNLLLHRPVSYPSSPLAPSGNYSSPHRAREQYPSAGVPPLRTSSTSTRPGHVGSHRTTSEMVEAAALAIKPAAKGRGQRSLHRHVALSSTASSRGPRFFAINSSVWLSRMHV